VETLAFLVLEVAQQVVSVQGLVVVLVLVVALVQVLAVEWAPVDRTQASVVVLPVAWAAFQRVA